MAADHGMGEAVAPPTRVFRALIGDLFASRAQALVNPVNCVGVTGKGIALDFKKRFPVMFDDYRHRCERKAVKLGEPYLYRDRSGVLIVNFPTKGHWRAVSRLKDVERGLDSLVARLAEWKVESIALPPLGVGSGLEWAEEGPLMYRKLHDQSVDVEVYAPLGTPADQLTTAFLQSPSGASVDRRGQVGAEVIPDQVVLMEVLRELQALPDASPVGRTIFRRICYVLTAMGVPTGLEYLKASYGPFSPDVKTVLHEFANRNWLREEYVGRMMALRVGQDYEKERGRFESQTQPHRKKLMKTVDLFRGIRSTKEADEVVTVLFASRELKHGKRSRSVTEQEIFDFILNWKKSWSTEDQKRALATTIRNLVLRRWVRAQISESMLPVA